MFIYYFIILICIEVYWIINVVNKRYCILNNNTKTSNLGKRNKFYFILISILMIVVIGCRDKTIGIDTMNYYNDFNRYTLKNDFKGYALETFNILEINNIEEPGYVILKVIFNKLGLNFQIFLIAMGILYISIITYYVYFYSKSPCFSYIIFIAFGYFTFSMSTIRQTIAMSITMIAFIFALKKKIIPFIITVLLASSIHTTAIIFLPAYFVTKFKVNKQSILFFILLSITLIVMKQPIITVLNEYARLSYESVATGGNMMYIFFIITALLGLIFNKQMYEGSKKNNPFLCMMLITVAIFPIAKFNPAVFRLHYYYSIFMIIYIPNMLANIINKSIKNIGYTAYAFLMMYMFFLQSDYVQLKIAPYSFFL